MWEYGEHILLRNLNHGRPSMVVPATVVEDTSDLIALYVAMGTPTKIKVALDGSKIPRSLPYAERFGRPWKLGDGVWHSGSVLWLSKPELPYMIGVFWEEPAHRYVGLYCNLQAPLRRHELGFDTADNVLDVQFWPDRSWNWKDEDEFDDAQRIGRLTADEAIRVRRVGEQIIQDWESSAWPFDRDWSVWQPDDRWTIPGLPTDWDRLFD